MKKMLIGSLAAAATLGCVVGCGRVLAESSREDAKPRSVSLTIYKQDFGLVHETRKVDLREGRTRLHLDTISKTLDPNSVIFDWPSIKGADVVSETYDLGVDSGQSLLKRLEGKTVEMLWNTQDGRPRETTEGVLEASQEGGFVFRAGDRLYVNPNGTIVARGEDSLVTMPRLSVEVDSKSPSSTDLGFAYQTRGMSWSADYVCRLAPDAAAMQLECWATLENHTGIDYPDARITLVAGSPNRAAETTFVRKARMQYGFGGGMAAAETDSSGFNKAEAGAVGELYAYKVPSAASVGQEQMNRVKMLASAAVPIKKDYSIRLDSAGPYDYGYASGQNPRRQSAQLAISLVNDETSGLGMPLPSGALRVYDQSSSDATAFVGAASIGDTPKNQHVNLTLSKVFDVYSDSKVRSSLKIDKRTVRRTYETVLHNEKKAAVEIRLVQTLYGKWRLVSESDKSTKLDAATYQRVIRLGPGEQRTVTWSADFIV